MYVKYWASWCSICLAGLDEIDELSTQKKDFKVITIVNPNYKGEQSPKDFIKWFKGLQEEKTATNLTVLLDEDGKLAQKLGVRGYPTSFYIVQTVFWQNGSGQNPNDVIINNFKDIS